MLLRHRRLFSENDARYRSSVEESLFAREKRREKEKDKEKRLKAKKKGKGGLMSSRGGGGGKGTRGNDKEKKAKKARAKKKVSILRSLSPLLCYSWQVGQQSWIVRREWRGVRCVQV